MLCPFSFPLLNSPSFLTSSLMNEPQTQRRGLKIYGMETSKAGRVEEEDYIDIEIRTSISGEFEFQMFSSSTFHVTQNLAFEEECRVPSIAASSSLSTISPSESSGGSCELWCKKMRLIKQSSVTQKLKSSRAYLRSLFMGSGCSNENNCVKAVRRVECSGEEGFKEGKNMRRHEAPSFTMKSILERDQMDDKMSFTCHRNSFSEAIKRHCTSKCYNSTSSSSPSPPNCSSSSSSFSLKSTNAFYEISLLKRNISGNTEVENSIEGAIAYCKKTHLKHDNSQPKMAVRGRPEICSV